MSFKSITTFTVLTGSSRWCKTAENRQFLGQDTNSIEVQNTICNPSLVYLNGHNNNNLNQNYRDFPCIVNLKGIQSAEKNFNLVINAHL